MKKFIIILLALLISNPAFAAIANIEEEDGSPSVYPWKLKVSNGSLTDNLDGTASLNTGGGGSSEANTKDINQASHGFSVGDVIRHNGTIFTKAQADSEANAEVYGIVDAVADTNNFTILTGGYIDGLSGLTAGSEHYLSEITAGALTTTEPSGATEISKPILLADTTTTGYFFNMRGRVGTAASGADPTKIIDGDNDTQIQVEESADEDYIRMDTAGSERFTINSAGYATFTGNLSTAPTTTESLFTIDDDFTYTGAGITGATKNFALHVDHDDDRTLNSGAFDLTDQMFVSFDRSSLFSSTVGVHSVNHVIINADDSGDYDSGAQALATRGIFISLDSNPDVNTGAGNFQDDVNGVYMELGLNPDTAGMTSGTFTGNIYAMNVNAGSIAATDTTYHGLYNTIDGAETNWWVNNASTANNWMGEDNAISYYGTGKDAEIYYDGTDLIIDPDQVGTGSVSIGGNVSAGDATFTSVTITNNAHMKRAVSVIVFSDADDVATGDGAGDVFYRIPSILDGYNLVDVAAHVQTAGTTGTTDIQIHNVTDAVDMLSTKITIDSTEKDSATAATPAVINTSNDDVATADEIRIDVDAVSTTAPKGLLVEMQFNLP